MLEGVTNLTTCNGSPILLFYKCPRNVDKSFENLNSLWLPLHGSYICLIEEQVYYIETDLQKIAAFSADKVAENDRFRLFLQERDAEQIDLMVNRLDKKISSQVNCTECGNCCKSLMIMISDAEADNLSGHLNQSRADFDTRYLEKGSNGLMIVNQMPCHFLADNKCTVYEHRFEGCKEFPALHIPGFKKRLFTTFMHYERCPIIFNVMEELKNEMTFERNPPL